MNTQRPPYQGDPIMEQLSRCPDVAAAIKEIDLAGLRKIGALYQMEQHSAILGASITDREAIDNIVAYCKGANGLIMWIEALREELLEYERGEGGGADDGDDG